MARVASRRVGGRRRRSRPGRLNSIRSPAIALSLASFDKERAFARTSSCPTRPPASSASVAIVAWSPLGLQAHGARPFGPWPSGQARPVAPGGWAG
jgi:hypothetical protein